MQKRKVDFTDIHLSGIIGARKIISYDKDLKKLPLTKCIFKCIF